MARKRTWVRYIEATYGVTLRRTRASVDLAALKATQSEIELIKYRLVSEEGFRVHEPILLYHGRARGPFIVDGHTRARVAWDGGEKRIPAIVFSCRDDRVDLTLLQEAQQAGGGRVMHVWDIPVVDRLGEGSEAWRRRREELMAKLDRPERRRT